MKHILTIFLVALFLGACQTPSAKNENSNIPATNVDALNSEIPTHNPAHGQPYHDCSIAVGAPLVVKAESSTNEVKVNPAHGQPGHRCDVAVGAPLT